LTTLGLRCPKCGAEMNHQANKLVQPVSEEDVAALTEAFDGVIEEVFACPTCGWIESRRLASEDREH
jgi:exosome complex RNA-binding protein Csl4